MRFIDKAAVVTGAGQGIGMEICRALLKEGCRIVLNDADPSLAASAAKTLSDFGDCRAVGGDASKSETVTEMVRCCVESFGGIDIAIANAGITLFGDFLEYPEGDVRRVLEVNALGSFLLAQASAREMVKTGRGGSILFMSSVVGHQAHRGLAAYAMTKAALEMLAKNLVIEVSRYGINVNAVAPGATLTERTLSDQNYAAEWSGLTPMGRPASVNDIAAAALFLVSDEARHVTGQSLVIDGGWTSISPNPS